MQKSFQKKLTENRHVLSLCTLTLASIINNKLWTVIYPI